MFRRNAILSFLLFICFHTFCQEVYTVDVRHAISPVQPTMWGLFFEDINRGADGGLYAELIKNRSFDFPDPLMGWHTVPARHLYARNDVFQIINQSASNANDPKYLQVTINNPEKITLTNEGFNGIAIKIGMQYELTLVCRQQKTGIHIKIDVLNAGNKSVGSTTISPGNPKTIAGEGWQTYKANIITTDTTAKGKLLVTFEGTGRIDVDRISLFPSDTWKKREGGLRNDLVQKLYDIKPGFFRFPGGCIVEGRDISNRYQWKTTIGPLEERKLLFNIWNNGMEKRPTPDYYQSFGLGFFEYFQLCEDLKSEPMPILNCGLSCQFDMAEVVPLDQMDPYIQDALDLIEFANGSANTIWGKKRVDMGHPAPFNMKFLGVGNENWGPHYVERLRLFISAIKSKYPYIQIITSTGYSPNPQFRYIDSVLRQMKVDIIDEHYYETAEWFLRNANKYDNYDRMGPKIFLGEYACHSVRIGSADNKNTLLCALSEAAFMTGLERNADIVTMAAYAPLFAHVKDWQWTPNLIWFDNEKSYGTPSYYVQQLFSLNKGSHVVPITENGNSVAGRDSVWASAVIDRNKDELIIKLVNPSGIAKKRTFEIAGLKKKNTTGTTTILKGKPEDMNSLENPHKIVPTTNSVGINNGKLLLELPPYSLTAGRVKL